MGQVFRATDTALGRQVAIKILPEAFASDPDRLARFEREARTLASLNHPHIAAIYGFERSAGANALVMELVEGEDLSRIIARGAVPIDEALAIAGQIAEALEAAHERGIIHRDLKPANIKVRPDGTVKVLDFGLAKAVAPNDASAAADDAMNSPTLSAHATEAGVILGTAAYMSPEQARGRVIDKRSDIWAFGCVLFEILSGKRAFDGEDSTEIIAAVMKTTPAWAALPAATPHRIVTLIQRCLEKDRQLRTGDIAVARFVIDEATSVDGLQAVGTPPRSRTGAVAAALALALAVALATLAWIHFREQPPAAKVVRFEIPAPAVMGPGATTSISPDGKHLAIVARGPNGLPLIWLQSLDSLEAKPLAGTEYASDTFWSPDSRFIAFSVPGYLRKVPIAGGTPQNLCDLPSMLRGGAWSVSGDIVFGSVDHGLMRIRDTGSTPTPVSTLAESPKESNHAGPWFLPDGRHFLYTRNFGLGHSAVYLGAVDAPPEQQPKEPLAAGAYGPAYSPSSANAGWLMFIREGSLLAQPFDLRRFEAGGKPMTVAEGFAVTAGPRPYAPSADGMLTYRSGFAVGSLGLTWFNRDGKALETVGQPGAYNTVSLSPDGTRVVVSRADATNSNSDLWILDLSRGASSRFTFDQSNEWIGVWSPDGRDIAYSSDRPGNNDLYRKDSNGTGKEEALLTSPVSEYLQDWSPDRRFLIFSTAPGVSTNLDLGVLDVDRHTSTPFIKTEFTESQAKFSPDGRFVVYSSNESGTSQIYAQTFPDPQGGKWMISVDGGTQPRWRRDGRELYFISLDSQVMAVEVNTTKGWTAGVPKALFLAPIWGGGQTNNVVRYDVSPDGKRFLINTEASDGKAAGISVVLNWEGLLKR